MSIPYLNIFRAAALRAGQLADAADSAAFEAIYSNATLANALGGVEIPQSEFKRQILASEKHLISIIARTENPVLRRPLEAVSANIANRGVVPATDSASVEWIGDLSEFFEAGTHEPLTEKPLQAIRRYNRLIDDDVLLCPKYHFALSGNRLEHTVGSAYARGISWSYTTQAAAYGTNAGGNSPLPQECESWWIADVLANIVTEGWFDQEAGIYAGIAAKVEGEVKGGMIPQATLPDNTAYADPVKN